MLKKREKSEREADAAAARTGIITNNLSSNKHAHDLSD
jgi:hypothetical protein